MQRKLDYRKLKKEKLFSTIKDKKKIYLDLNFLINFRDVVYSRSTNKYYLQLYEKLKILINKNLIICPISEIIFLEVLKQSGEPEFFETINIIEELSQNIIIENEQTIVFLTYYQYFIKSLNVGISYDISKELWSWVIDIFGHKIPPTHKISTNDEEDFQHYKSYLDFTWGKSLTELIKISAFGNKRRDNNQPFVEYINKLNSDNQNYTSDFQTFEQVYNIERTRMLDAHKVIAWRAFEKTINEFELKIEKEESFKIFESLMYKFIEDVSKTPGIINIPAGLHALFRYEKRNHKESNDIFDYHHSYNALPYFDYFFTERRLTNVLTHQRLKFNILYNCVVEYRVDEILKIIENDFN